MSGNLVHIIIPVHNRKEFTRECLASLRRQTVKGFQIIVIDDGSTDGTSEMIEEEFREVVLLRGDGSLWWAGATNLGVEHALAQAGRDDYILTLNDDTTVRPDYLETLLNSALKHPGSMIGSIVVSDSGESTVEDGGVRINWMTAKFTNLAKGKRYQDGILSGNNLYPVDVLSGRGTLIPVEVLRSVGLYDAVKLPHYGADYEFSHRAQHKGYKLFIDYQAAVSCRVSATGIDNKRAPLSWGELGKSFFTIRSANCIRYRWNFARLTCPTLLWPVFFVFDLCRVCFGAVRNQLRSKRGVLEKVLDGHKA